MLKKDENKRHDIFADDKVQFKPERDIIGMRKRMEQGTPLATPGVQLPTKKSESAGENIQQEFEITETIDSEEIVGEFEITETIETDELQLSDDNFQLQNDTKSTNGTYNIYENYIGTDYNEETKEKNVMSKEEMEQVRAEIQKFNDIQELSDMELSDSDITEEKLMSFADLRKAETDTKNEQIFTYSSEEKPPEYAGEKEREAYLSAARENEKIDIKMLEFGEEIRSSADDIIEISDREPISRDAFEKEQGIKPGKLGAKAAKSEKKTKDKIK